MFSLLDAQAVDALLAGTSPVDPDLESVAEVVKALRRLADREPVPAMSDALRAQLASTPMVPIGIHRTLRSARLKAVAAAAVAAAVVPVGVAAAETEVPG